MKVEMFHGFYQTIEEIHINIIKDINDPLVVENIDFEMKIEGNSIQTQKQQAINEANVFEDDSKYESGYGNNYWHNEFNDGHTNEATSMKIEEKTLKRKNYLKKPTILLYFRI